MGLIEISLSDIMSYIINLVVLKVKRGNPIPMKAKRVTPKGGQGGSSGGKGFTPARKGWEGHYAPH